jgi:Recombination endonuclease VII
VTPPEEEYPECYPEFQRLPKPLRNFLDDNPGLIPVESKARENLARKLQKGLRLLEDAKERTTKLSGLPPAELMVRKRIRQIWTKYALGKSDLLEMLKDQDWKCAICGVRFEDISYHVDHDHITGAVRGLLCRRCNLRIGGWDDPEWAKAAAIYLKIPGMKRVLFAKGVDRI